MALDLSALEEKPVPSGGAVAQPDGKAMRVKLADIEPDPNQPRTEKNAEEIAEIGQDIKNRGVKLPISVKPHPTKSGKWIINDGELRFLGSQWAKVEDIPVVVDEDFDDFDQVNVNEKRFNLRPIELAQFVQKKLDEGFKKGDIAKRLGKPGNFITEVLALIDAPACVSAVYQDGRCTSPKTIYELRALAEKFPEQVQEWCESGADVTRRSVAELGDILKGKKEAPAPLPSPEENEKDETLHDAGGSPGEADDLGKFRHDEKTEHGEDFEHGEDLEQVPGTADGEREDLGELSSGPREKALPDPDAIKKPLLLVEYDGRSAAVLLNRKPSSPGLLRIRYEDGGGDDEVDAGLCKINMLAEG